MFMKILMPVFIIGMILLGCDDKKDEKNQDMDNQKLNALYNIVREAVIPELEKKSVIYVPEVIDEYETLISLIPENREFFLKKFNDDDGFCWWLLMMSPLQDEYFEIMPIRERSTEKQKREAWIKVLEK